MSQTESHCHQACSRQVPRSGNITGTDVISRTHGHANRDIINCFTPCVVEQEAHIHETKKPSVRWSPKAVKDGVAQSFDVLVLTFSRVLMLLMWLTLPSGYV
jgi:hypothetical protein